MDSRLVGLLISVALFILGASWAVGRLVWLSTESALLTMVSAMLFAGFMAIGIGSFVTRKGNG